MAMAGLAMVEEDEGREGLKIPEGPAKTISEGWPSAGATGLLLSKVQPPRGLRTAAYAGTGMVVTNGEPDWGVAVTTI